MARLKKEGLVRSRRQGYWIYYSLAPARGRFHRTLLACLDSCAREDATLCADARRCGIRTLGALALSGNRAMRALARKLGAILRPDADPDLIQMQWEISA